MPEPGTFCIFRSRDQGVVCGYLRLLAPTTGGLMYAEVGEARQVWNWSGGVNTLMEMANTGAGRARISEPLANPFTMSGVCGVYPCTPTAEANLRQSRWDKDYAPSAAPPSSTRNRGRS